MTIQDKIKQYEAAIREAELQLDNPSLPEAAAEAIEETIVSMSNKLIDLKYKLKLQQNSN